MPITTTQVNISGLILLAPLVLFILGCPGKTAVFALIMICIPLVLGIAAQKQKGRTGMVWVILSFIVIFIVHVMAGASGSSNVGTYTVMFGIAPMILIIWSLPNRTLQTSTSSPGNQT